MPASSSFPACCGVNILSGFLYDDDCQDEWGMTELAKMPSEISSAEGTYCHCHLICLTPEQTAAAEVIKGLGYELIGTFESCDGPYQVSLYARGLDKIEPKIEAPKAKKPKKKQKKQPKKRKRLTLR